MMPATPQPSRLKKGQPGIGNPDGVVNNLDLHQSSPGERIFGETGVQSLSSHAVGQYHPASPRHQGARRNENPFGQPRFNPGAMGLNLPVDLFQGCGIGEANNEHGGDAPAMTTAES